MRTLTRDQVKEIESRARLAMMQRLVTLCAGVTKRTFRETVQALDVSNLRELFADENARMGYVGVWRETVAATVMASEFIVDTDVALYVEADWSDTALETHIDIIEEEDGDD
jgi:hypothetical protein